MKYDEFGTILEESTGITSERLSINYNEGDTRCWSAIVDKGNSNLIITYHVNKTDFRHKCFDLLGHRKQLIEVSEDEIYDKIKTIVN